MPHLRSPRLPVHPGVGRPAIRGGLPRQQLHAVSTAKLIEAHRERIRLAGISTGYAMRRPARRGLRTFQPIHALEGRVKEFTVEWSIPDLADLVAGGDAGEGR